MRLPAANRLGPCPSRAGGDPVLLPPLVLDDPLKKKELATDWRKGAWQPCLRYAPPNLSSKRLSTSSTTQTTPLRPALPRTLILLRQLADPRRKRRSSRRGCFFPALCRGERDSDVTQRGPHTQLHWRGPHWREQCPHGCESRPLRSLSRAWTLNKIAMARLTSSRPEVMLVGRVS